MTGMRRNNWFEQTAVSTGVSDRRYPFVVLMVVASVADRNINRANSLGVGLDDPWEVS